MSDYLDLQVINQAKKYQRMQKWFIEPNFSISPLVFAVLYAKFLFTSLVSAKGAKFFEVRDILKQVNQCFQIYVATKEDSKAHRQKSNGDNPEELDTYSLYATVQVVLDVIAIKKIAVDSAGLSLKKSFLRCV